VLTSSATAAWCASSTCAPSSRAAAVVGQTLPVCPTGYARNGRAIARVRRGERMLCRQIQNRFDLQAAYLRRILRRPFFTYLRR
jgi:hypothetical protein